MNTCHVTGQQTRAHFYVSLIPKESTGEGSRFYALETPVLDERGEPFKNPTVAAPRAAVIDDIVEYVANGAANLKWNVRGPLKMPFVDGRLRDAKPRDLVRIHVPAGSTEEEVDELLRRGGPVPLEFIVPAIGEDNLPVLDEDGNLVTTAVTMGVRLTPGFA